MNVITQNPFRILGLTANSTERELQKQIGIIKRYAEIGKSKSFDFDFEFIGDFKRDFDSVTHAASKIEQDHNRLHYALFWFVKNNSFDEIALNKLKEKQTDKAIEIWSKTLKGEVTNKNYSSYLNLATLYMALALKNEQLEIQKLQNGVSLKGSLIHSENLQDFSKLVTGNGVANEPIKISKKFANEVVELLKPYLNKSNGLSTNELISLFNTFPSNIQKYVSAKFTEVPVANIENKIDKTIRKRKDYPEEANKYGEDLYIATKNDISLLKQILGAQDIQFQMIVNKLANELIECSIVYYNYWSEDEGFDPFNNAFKIAKYAKNVLI